MIESQEDRAARFEAEHRREQRLSLPSKTCAGFQVVLAGSYVFASMTAHVPTGANVAEHWGSVARVLSTGLAGVSVLGFGCLLAFRSGESCGRCLLANALAAVLTVWVVMMFA